MGSYQVQMHHEGNHKNFLSLGANQYEKIPVVPLKPLIVSPPFCLFFEFYSGWFVQGLFFLISLNVNAIDLLSVS
jgi:hypothetical protein